ncbi:flavin-dependent dehydrogenase [Sphingomonas jejuensis]|uniref:Flavin-dependent dehydrogenase n=1 Tax=Sphingomonas jejuensis TaxID=904715 RepID=A0ABX0XNS9_9SPHN|nr:FAD-dependent monooxygenase [Sphingomonas jejuensis]NJC35036.1 flavin-dependent dehydrogenase [Sphingomonas jejuensis]
MRRTAALIVGGGPAGSAAAITLARAGHRPLLVERSREPADALCGGFLSWRSVERLATLGIDPPGHRVTRLRIVAGRHRAEADLPAPAIGISRRWLDAALLDRAAVSGAGVERGIHVREVADGAVRLGNGATLSAEALFLAVGKHDVRGAPRGRTGADPTLGLRVRAEATPGLSGVIELHLFRGGYAGIVLQEDGRANICLAIAKSRLTEASGDPRRLLMRLAAESPAFADRLQGSEGVPIDAIAGVPYGWRANAALPGCFRIGDQAAVIPSLAGEGMGIALMSGMSAARAFDRDGVAAAPPWQRATARRVRAPMAVAGVIRHLGEGRLRTLAPALAAGVPGLVSLVARTTRVPD